MGTEWVWRLDQCDHCHTEQQEGLHGAAVSLLGVSPLVTIPFSSIRFNVALSVYYKYPRYSCVNGVCPTITAALTRLTAARRHTEQLCAARCWMPRQYGTSRVCVNWFVGSPGQYCPDTLPCHYVLVLTTNHSVFCYCISWTLVCIWGILLIYSTLSCVYSSALFLQLKKLSCIVFIIHLFSGQHVVRKLAHL